jgi:hypothetical protein
MHFDAKLLLAAMALSGVVPVVAFATWQIAAAYLLGAIAVGTFIAVAASRRSRPDTDQLEQVGRQSGGAPTPGARRHR